MPDIKQLAAVLEEARLKAGYGRDELATKAGIKRRNIEQWEGVGDVFTDPGASRLARVTKALGKDALPVLQFFCDLPLAFADALTREDVARFVAKLPPHLLSPTRRRIVLKALTEEKRSLADELGKEGHPIQETKPRRAKGRNR